MLTRLTEASYMHAKMACYLCNRPDDVVDTGMSIEGEGVLALCVRCVHDLAFEAGMDPEAAAEVEMMVELVTRLNEERDAEKKLTKKLRGQIRDQKTELATLAEEHAQALIVAGRVEELESRLAAYEQEFGQ